jgi:hypothetical protein
MTLTAQSIPLSTLASSKHTRLVSFENSNSFLKRHDSEGSLVIAAGHRENPSVHAHTDDENPIVILEGQRPDGMALESCQGDHVSNSHRSKIETARESFAACLRPSDDGRDLIVIASHWDKPALEALKVSLLGQYKVIRNGVKIQCAVTQVIPTMEGLGSYHSAKSQLKDGSTLLIELGYGTAEIWFIDESGQIVDGAPVTRLGVINLVKALADDPTVRALTQDNSGTVNLSAISQALQQDTLGKISAANWQALKAKYASEFLKDFQGYLRTQHAFHMQSASNLVLTGGGAALLSSIQPKLSQVFIVPTQPQTASVRGAYERQMSNV